MIERTERRFSLKPRRLIGDTAYGTAKMLNWLVEEQCIEPRVPVWEKAERNDATFARSDFSLRIATPVPVATCLGLDEETSNT